MMAVGRDLTVSRLFMAWVVNAGFENGEVYFAKGTVEGTEKVLGVVVWFPPGRSVDNKYVHPLRYERTLGLIHPLFTQ